MTESDAGSNDGGVQPPKGELSSADEIPTDAGATSRTAAGEITSASIDPADVAVIAAAVWSLHPGCRVTRIEEQ